MVKKRILAAVLALLVFCSAAVFSGCGVDWNSLFEDLGIDGSQSSDDGQEEVELLPEEGSWHAAVMLSSIKSVPFWQRALLALVAGNVAFEVNLEIDAIGTFSYETNTDALKEKIAESAGTVVGFFIKDVDLSDIIDRAVEAVLPENIMGSADRNCYGAFVKDSEGMLNAVTTKGDLLYFKMYGKKLVQLDKEGETVLTFERP
ncbi:MAG: hypothetical protein J6T65_08200 [Clostridia bacterium]|nr:hypothetical protein [Clostridia bacterium]MBO7659274.1 hypothetical protein [Clostridia bacterium]